MDPAPHELRFASAAELATLLANREISAVELARWSIAHLETEGRALNAVATIVAERAMVTAEAADARLARGAREPLLGIPFGAKDLLTARGAATTFGSAAYRDNVIDHDAAPIAGLERAGAVLVAKLAMAELAGFMTANTGLSLHGPGRNPWNPDRWAGGSSSGSGAAVGAGLLPIALGSETAGSIGAPSAWCGVTGLRPTPGLVSTDGCLPLAPTLDKVGPIGRTVDDLAIVLEAIVAPSNAPWSPAALSDVINDIARDRTRIRVGLAERDFEIAAPGAVRGPLATAVEALRDLGVRFRPSWLPSSIPYREILNTIMNAEGARSFEALYRSPAFDVIGDPAMRAGMLEAREIPLAEYEEALDARRDVIAACDAIFDEVDLIVSYNFAWPRPIPALGVRFDEVPIDGGNTALVWAGNLAGLPALFLPAGIGTDGMPVGIQLVGPPFSEPVLFAIGRALQASTDWHRIRPPS